MDARQKRNKVLGERVVKALEVPLLFVSVD